MRTKEGRQRYELLKKADVFSDEEEDTFEGKTDFPSFVDHMTKAEQVSV